MKSTITISYYALEEPQVDLPDALKETIDINFIDLMEKDSLVLEHAGVKVYRTYKDEHHGAVEEWSDHWLSTEVWTDWENDICFDGRVLPAVPPEDLLHYQAMSPDSPLKQRLAYSIDKGFITKEGYDNHG